MVEIAKPWDFEKQAAAHAEYAQLRLTKSFLENQLVGVNDRMAELRSLIIEGINLGYQDAGLKPTGEPKTTLGSRIDKSLPIK